MQEKLDDCDQRHIMLFGHSNHMHGLLKRKGNSRLMKKVHQKVPVILGASRVNAA